MKFHPLIITGVMATALHAQIAETSTDPFADTRSKPPKKASEAKPPNHASSNISICYETFSLPLSTSALWQREGLADTAMYQRLVDAVEEGTAQQENFVILRARPGELATSEGISEYVYPTEFEPPELPNQVGVAISKSTGEKGKTTPEDPAKLQEAPEFPALTGLRTPATPTSFDTRNTGFTLEAEANIDQTGQVVDLRIRPDHVALVGRTSWGQDFSTVEIPEFEKQGLSAAATIRINSPHFLGTISRTPNSKVNPDSAKRVWFAFVTVTLPKP